MPLAWYPRLLSATPAQRANWRVAGGGFGIHWPDVDEDLSTEGLLRGGRPANRLTRKTSPGWIALDDLRHLTPGQVGERLTSSPPMSATKSGKCWMIRVPAGWRIQTVTLTPGPGRA